MLSTFGMWLGITKQSEKITDIFKEGRMGQTTLQGLTTCESCVYGRDLGANDYGCRSEKRRASGEKMVNKGDYSCDYAEGK